ncbi:MAG: DUF3467 domain-containing protein [Bacteroidales bacterium]
MEDQKKKQQLNIELSEETGQGTYSNLAIITHSVSEFVVDFVRLMPGIKKAQVKSRIILTPEHAKKLLHALQDNVSKYESMHGKIKNIEGFGGNNGGSVNNPQGFGSSNAEA